MGHESFPPVVQKRLALVIMQATLTQLNRDLNDLERCLNERYYAL